MMLCVHSLVSLYGEVLSHRDKIFTLRVAKCRLIRGNRGFGNMLAGRTYRTTYGRLFTSLKH